MELPRKTQSDFNLPAVSLPDPSFRPFRKPNQVITMKTMKERSAFLYMMLKTRYDKFENCLEHYYSVDQVRILIMYLLDKYASSNLIVQIKLIFASLLSAHLIMVD